MGLTGMAAGAAMNRLQLNNERKRLLQGRNPGQQSVIKYFLGSGGGCLSMFSSGGGLTDEQYEGMVMSTAKATDFKAKALGKIGLDESQVSEIEPIHFEGYRFDDKNAWAKYGKDGKWRSSAYQISWIFFSATQVYVYQYTFNMDQDGRVELTEEYFYKDITNCSTTSDTVEKNVVEKSGCRGEEKVTRKNVESTRFTIVVPGDKFYCSMEQSEYTERAVQGMKAKLREKKG
jgi:hypothetical protein